MREGRREEEAATPIANRPRSESLGSRRENPTEMKATMNLSVEGLLKERIKGWLSHPL